MVEWIAEVVRQRPAQCRALSSPLGVLVMIGRGPPPRRRRERYTQDGDVIRQAAVAKEILRTQTGLEGHPDLLVALAGQMVAEVQAERRIIAKGLRDLAERDGPLARVADEIAWIADDIEDAERDEDGAFRWAYVDAEARA